MKDVVTEQAAELFDVPYDEVTQAQRSVAKQWRHAVNFSVGGIKAGRMLGMYPVKVEPRT